MIVMIPRSNHEYRSLCSSLYKALIKCNPRVDSHVCFFNIWWGPPQFYYEIKPNYRPYNTYCVLIVMMGGVRRSLMICDHDQGSDHDHRSDHDERSDTIVDKVTG